MVNLVPMVSNNFLQFREHEYAAKKTKFRERKNLKLTKNRTFTSIMQQRRVMGIITHIEIMLCIIESQIERHIGMVDVNIHKLYHIIMRYLPQ